MSRNRDASPSCRVCLGRDTRSFLEIDGAHYTRCETCLATLLDPPLPEAQTEWTHYLTHENAVDDPGYRAFLGRLADPLLTLLAPVSTVLDYGCGPGPALARILSEGGHAVALYDPFFAPDRAPLARCYDAVTCTEVIEHFHEPAAEFARLFELVRPGGLLALMTCLQTDDARFAAWHYRRDPTHVTFYREATLRLLAERQGWRFETPRKDVAFLFRPEETMPRARGSASASARQL